MHDRDELSTIVIERDSGGAFGSFVLGALVGAGLALLFAPRSGEETQEELRARARELRDATEDRVRETQKQLEERLALAREGVQERVDTVKEAVEQGREAAREARTDLEHRIERSKAAYRAGVEAARSAAAEESGASEDDDEG